jgi:competence protein ComEC
MPLKLYKILLILSAIAVITAVPTFWLTYSQVSPLEVDFLDVGQGDAILIKTPSGQNILIDGGPSSKVLNQLGKNLSFFDKTIDLMVLTHPHDDHVNGLNEVIKRYEIKKIIYTGVAHNAPGYITWLKLVKDKKIPVTIIDRPQTIAFADDCQLKILYPQKSFLNKEVNNLNNTSIVAKLIYGETSFLFTGDSEKETESQLVKTAKTNKSDLLAQVLKVGHHGSDTASTQDFLKAVSPNLAVIEVGKNNQFNHPNERIVNRLERMGIRIFRTDFEGTVRMTSDGKIIKLLKAGKSIMALIETTVLNDSIGLL